MADLDIKTAKNESNLTNNTTLERLIQKNETAFSILRRSMVPVM